MNSTTHFNTRIRKSVKAAIFFALLSASGRGVADAYYNMFIHFRYPPHSWIGNGANRNWTNPDNWSDRTVPGATDTVNFNSACYQSVSACSPIVDANLTVGNIVITSTYLAGATISANAGVTVSVTGTITQDSNTIDMTNASSFTVGGLTDLNAGTIALSSTANSLSTTSVDGGTLNFAGTTAMAALSESAGTINLGGSPTFSSTVTMTGGTFNTLGTNMTVPGLFSMSGGTFNNTTAAVALNGGLTQTSGTFNAGTGAGSTFAVTGVAAITGNADFNGAQDTTDFTGDVTFGSSGTFATAGTTNINGAGNTLASSNGTITLGGPLNLGDAWTMTGGAVNTTTQTVTVAGLMSMNGGTYTSTTGTNNFNGGFSQNPSPTAASTFTGGSSTNNFGSFAFASKTGAGAGSKFDAGSGAWNVNGAFGLSGTWSAAACPSTPCVKLSSATTTITGNVSLAGAANISTYVSANSGTFKLLTTGTQTFAINVTTSFIFSNLTFAFGATTGTNQVTFSGTTSTLQANAQVSFQSGAGCGSNCKVDNTGFLTLTVNNGNIVTTGDGATGLLKMNVIGAASSIGADTNLPSGLITINKTAPGTAVTISNGGITNIIGNLTITRGTVTMAADLNVNPTTTHALTINNGGTLICNGFNLNALNPLVNAGGVLTCVGYGANWTGSTGDGKWSTAANWSGGVVPAVTDSVVFDSSFCTGANCDCTVDVAAGALSLSLYTGYTGVITQGASDFTVGAGGINMANGTIVATSGGMSNAGPFTMTGGTYSAGSGSNTHTGAFNLSGGTYTPGGGTTNTFSGAFTQSGGTIGAGSGNLNFASTTNITAGTFNAPSGTTTFTGAFAFGGTAYNGGTGSATFSTTAAVSAGTFTSGSGTYTHTGAFTLSGGAWNGAGTNGFNSTVNVTGGTFSTLTSTVAITGAYTQSGGTFNANATGGTLSFASTLGMTGGTFNGGTGDFTVTGATTLNSSAAVIAFNAGAGDITFTGNFTQTRGSSGNTFTGGAGDLKFSGTFNMTSTPTFSGGSGANTFSGNSFLAGFASGATFTPTTGTTTFNTTSATLTIKLNGGSAGAFSNVNIQTGGTTTVTLTGTMNVSGTALNIGDTAGVGQLNGGTINVNGNGAVLSMTGNGYRGTTALAMKAAAGQSQSISTAGGATCPGTQMPALTISANATGTVNFGANCLQPTAYTYTAGLINAGTSTLYMNATSTITDTGARSLNNLTFAGNNATYTISGTVKAAGLVSLADTGTTGTFSGGTINAVGDVAVTGNGIGGTTTTLKIGGSTPQTFTGTAGAAGRLPAVQIASTGGGVTLVDFINVTGAYTYASGTVTATGSTLNFMPSVNQTITDTGAVSYNNVTFSPQAAITYTVSGTLKAGGILTFAQGSGSYAITMTGGTVQSLGGLTVGATTTTYSGTTNVTVAGSGTQTVTGNGTAPTLPNFVINAPGGNVTLSGTIALANNFTYTAGTVSSTGSTLHFASKGATTIVDNGTVTYNNITFAPTAALTYTLTGSTLKAGGILTFAQGTGSYGITMTGGTVESLGGLTITATTTTYSGTTMITAAGGSSQTLTGNGAAPYIPNLTINSSGTVSISGVLSLAGNYTFTAGTVSAAGSTLYFNTLANATISDTAGTATYGAITFSPQAALTYTLTGSTLNAGGLVTFAQGVGGVTITMSGGAINSLGGTTVGATTTKYIGSTDLVMAGSNAQTLTGGGTAPTIPNLVINSTNTVALSGTIAVYGDYTFTAAGGLNATGSTLYFPSGAATAITDTGTATLGNVTFAPTSSITYTVSGTVNVGGTLTFAGGSGLNVTTTGGTLNSLGGTSVTATTTNYSGTTVVNVSGSGSQTIAGNGAAATLPNLTINASGGSVTLSGILGLAGDYTYAAGSLSPGSSTLYFNSKFATTNVNDTGGSALNAVTFAPAVTTTYNISGTVKAGGLLTFAQGGGGLAITMTGGTLNSQGGTSVTATTTNYSGTTVVNVAGSGSQTITGNGAVPTIPNLTLNGTGAVSLSGIIGIAGNYVYTAAGSVAPGTSTLFFASKSSPVTITDPGTATYNAVTFSPSLATTYNITGTLKSGGVLNFGQGSGTLANTLNGGTLQSQGGITIAATTTTYGGSAVVKIGGSGSQTISGAANAVPTLPNLTINTAGSVTFTSGKFINLTGDYVYTSGSITATGSTLTLAKTGAATITDTGTQTLGNVTFASGNASAYTMTGSTMKVGGTLTFANTNSSSTITDGTFAVVGTAVTYSSSGGPGNYALTFSAGSAATLTNSTGSATAVTTGDLTINSGTTLTFAGGSSTFGTTAGSTLTAGAGAVTVATIQNTGPFTIQFANMILNGNTFRRNSGAGNVLKVNGATVGAGAAFGGNIL